MNPIRQQWRLDRPLDVIANTAPTRTGGADPTGFVRDGKVWRAARFDSGPAALAVWTAGDRLHAEAWGPGAEEALAAVPDLTGLSDDDSGFDPTLHRFVHDAYRARPGVRLIRTGVVFDAAVRAILGQKVTGLQLKRSYRELVRRCREPAPLPYVNRRMLLLPPTPERVLDALAGHGATTLAIDITRTATLREFALVAPHFEALARRSSATELHAGLHAIPGVGVWTASEITTVALRDADAVSFGDFHLKNVVAFALAGEPRGTDDRMAELLEPFRPHRARAVRLIELSGVRAPRYGNRLEVPAHLPEARA